MVDVDAEDEDDFRHVAVEFMEDQASVKPDASTVTGIANLHFTNQSIL